MPMPEASIDEYAGAKSNDGEVGSAGQGLRMDSVSVTITEQETPHEHLGPSVFRPYLPHAITALLWCHLVSHTLLLSLLFFSHILPISLRHIALLFLRIDTFLYADSLEVCTPQFLKKVVVSTQQFGVEFSAVKVKRK